MEKKKSFLFYVNWEKQIDDMTNVEMRRFIKNLCRHSNDEEVELPTRIERAFWNGILPALENNKTKYEKKVEASKENGKLGGAPKGNQNARKEETTQNNLNKVIRDNSKEINDNCKKVNDNREMKNDNWQELNDKTESDRTDIAVEKTKVNLDHIEITPTPKPELKNYSSSGKKIIEIPDEYYDVLDKRATTGWNSLSVPEAATFWKYKDHYIKIMDAQQNASEEPDLLVST